MYPQSPIFETPRTYFLRYVIDLIRKTNKTLGEYREMYYHWQDEVIKKALKDSKLPHDPIGFSGIKFLKIHRQLLSLFNQLQAILLPRIEAELDRKFFKRLERKYDKKFIMRKKEELEDLNEEVSEIIEKQEKDPEKLMQAFQKMIYFMELAGLIKDTQLPSSTEEMIWEA